MIFGMTAMAPEGSLGLAAPVRVSAYTQFVHGNKSGQCGENCYCELDSDGDLRIYGAGPMYDFSDGYYVNTGKHESPWSSYYVENVVIEDGITYIGSYAFMPAYYYDNSKIRKVTLPKSLETIGSYAFYNCYSLQEIAFPEGSTEIGYRAFYNCPDLTKV